MRWAANLVKGKLHTDQHSPFPFLISPEASDAKNLYLPDLWAVRCAQQDTNLDFRDQLG